MFQKLLNSSFFRPMALVLATATISLSAHAAPAADEETVRLRAGTAMQLMLDQALNSDDVQVGQTVLFRLMDDVKVNGKIVISRGATAKGQVTEARGGKVLGIPGRLQLSIKSITAEDGSNVLLSDNGLNAKGKSRVPAAVILTVCCFFGFLIQGGDAVLPSGTMASVMTLNDVELTPQSK